MENDPKATVRGGQHLEVELAGTGLWGVLNVPTEVEVVSDGARLVQRHTGGGGRIRAQGVAAQPQFQAVGCGVLGEHAAVVVQSEVGDEPDGASQLAQADRHVEHGAAGMACEASVRGVDDIHEGFADDQATHEAPSVSAGVAC